MIWLPATEHFSVISIFSEATELQTLVIVLSGKEKKEMQWYSMGSILTAQDQTD